MPTAPTGVRTEARAPYRGAVPAAVAGLVRGIALSPAGGRGTAAACGVVRHDRLRGLDEPRLRTVLYRTVLREGLAEDAAGRCGARSHPLSGSLIPFIGGESYLPLW